ncbi:superoxide dismutase [Patescibacteria group bacterium]|nr:superoxide dismutase [Patescibacteria group bacterium]MCH7756519.1 superoxide dismutase [Patescibacteria group bacterium]
MTYTEQTFNIPDLKGLSAKQLEVHLGLYRGYVKHVNLIREKIHELEADKEKNSYPIAELRRRFSFEFDGMRMHEYYFEEFENGAQEIKDASDLKTAVEDKYGGWNGFIDHFTAVGMSRGIGWAVLYWDPKGKTPHTAWVSDHELGTLAGLPILLAMDMWEHAFMVDYLPSEKKEYINAFLSNLNWSVVEERFKKAG